MIIDKIENLKMYESVNPLFAKVVEFLAQNECATLVEFFMMMSGVPEGSNDPLDPLT